MQYILSDLKKLPLQERLSFIEQIITQPTVPDYNESGLLTAELLEILHEKVSIS